MLPGFLSSYSIAHHQPVHLLSIPLLLEAREGGTAAAAQQLYLPVSQSQMPLQLSPLHPASSLNLDSCLFFQPGQVAASW